MLRAGHGRAGQTDAPVDTDADLAEFEPIAPGPYDVGVQTITITDESSAAAAHGRRLVPDHRSPACRPTSTRCCPACTTSRRRRSPPIASNIAPDGPFPFVVYSHGSGGHPLPRTRRYPRRIASNGYIVVLRRPHRQHGDRPLRRDRDRVRRDRREPATGRQTIIDGDDESHDPRHGTVSSPRSTRSASRSPATPSAGSPPTRWCPAMTNDLGDVRGRPARRRDHRAGPATGDGSGRLLSDEMLASITIPSLVMVGTNDQTTPVDPNVDRPWELCEQRRRSYRADLRRTRHTRAFPTSANTRQTCHRCPTCPC